MAPNIILLLFAARKESIMDLIHAGDLPSPLFPPLLYTPDLPGLSNFLGDPAFLHRWAFNSCQGRKQTFNFVDSTEYIAQVNIQTLQLSAKRYIQHGHGPGEVTLSGV